MSYNDSAWNPSQPYTDPSNGQISDRRPGASIYRHQTVPAPQQHPMPALPRSQSASAPPPLPPLPPSLTPGGRQRGQSTSSHNLFFEQQTDYGFPRRTSDAVPDFTQSFYPSGLQRHAQSYTIGVTRHQQPPLPRKPLELQQAQSLPPPIPPKYTERNPSYTSFPTVPPKIPLYSQSIPGSFSSPASNLWPPEKPPKVSTPPSDEDKDLEIAMRLSEAAANERKQEEDDLTKALEESRISAVKSSSTTSSPVAVEVVVPDNVAHWGSGSSAPSIAQSLPNSPMLIDRNPMDSPLMEGEKSSTASPQALAAQFSDDEALARRLAAGNELEPADDQSSSQENAHDSARSRQQLYSGAVSNIAHTPGRPSSASATVSVDHSSSQPESTPESSLTRDNSVRSASSQQSTGSGPHTLLSPGHLCDSSPSPRPATPDPSSLSAAWPSAAMKKRPLSMMSSQSTIPISDSSPSIHANQFVEKELLLGVSLGFGPPAISTTLQPMSGTMPNIITLPYGKSSPLHLQAPSWRHLLKLMARLSGTRIEPAVEAVAVSNRELKLRTVVQFVKVHHLAQEWRLLLYLTIDHPVPANSPNGWKYTNGDVSTLPYSYTLSTLPSLLRGGADSAVATYYVIPSTPKTPLPTLPIYFPNMAMYLQSALEDSRRAMNDSSSGLRKLAKSVDAYFANDEIVGVEEGPEKRSFFKKVIGRGHKQPRRDRGGNEEVFELVTPFVPEEWG